MSFSKAVAAVLAGVAVLWFAGDAAAQYGTFTEDFETGYTHGAEIRTHPDWFTESGRTDPDTMNNVGVNGGWGVTNGNPIFTWVAHPFSFADAQFTKYVGKLDFETDGSGHFDDDRVGWMIRDNDDGSDWIFAVQMDPGGSGYNIEGYWDHASHGDDGGRPSICDIPALSGNTFYRLIAEFTKLTDTSCSIDVELWSLDAGGNPDALQCSGSIADTSALGSQSPMADYFTTATIWPAYKNYNNIAGDCDNAYAEIVPEPFALSLLGIGGLALLRRRGCR